MQAKPTNEKEQHEILSRRGSHAGWPGWAPKGTTWKARVNSPSRVRSSDINSVEQIKTRLICSCERDMTCLKQSRVLAPQEGTKRQCLLLENQKRPSSVAPASTFTPIQ